MSLRACLLSFFLTWLVKSIFVRFCFEHPIPIDIVDISVHIRCNGCILNYWHGWGYKSIVFGTYICLRALCVALSQGHFCIIIFYKSLPVQSLEIMRHNIHATSSMAAPKAVSSVARLLRGLRSAPFNSMKPDIAIMKQSK